MRLTAALLCALAACSAPMPDDGGDAGTTDATPRPDAPAPDAGPETGGPDAGPDAAADAPDGRSDAATEAGEDVAPDAPADGPAEGGRDATGCPDADGDGHPDRACGGDDCDDGDRAVYPGAIERCNGRDNDCSGAVATQAQGDAYCAATAPTPSTGRVSVTCAPMGPSGSGVTFTRPTCYAVYTMPRYECWQERGAVSNCCDVTVVCPR